MFKEFKIKIVSKEHSEAVQELMFSLRYGWIIPIQRKSRYTREGALFGHDSGQITHSRDIDSGKYVDYPLLTLADLYEMDKKPVVIKKKWHKVVSHRKDADLPWTSSNLYETKEQFYKECVSKENDYHWVTLTDSWVNEKGEINQRN